MCANLAQPGTLVEAAGPPVPPDFKGGSLVPLVYHGGRPAEETLFYEHYGAY